MTHATASSVKVLAASKCEKTGVMLWTLQLRYWRAIHAELMTHRVFSRGAGSSRAIPVKKILAQVWNDPAGPIHWGVNQSGMQARAELVGWRRALAGSLWRTAGKVMCVFAWSMMKLGLHKQVTNRLLEPWQYINVIVSSTRWDNFFNLRCHADAQPEFQELANRISFVMSAHRMDYLYKVLKPGEWHLPYITEDERRAYPIDTLVKLSTARNARVSYAPFDGDSTVEKEIARHDLLVSSVPRHSGPAEHVAMCTGLDEEFANFDGFMQYRKFVEDGMPVDIREPA